MTEPKSFLEGRSPGRDDLRLGHRGEDCGVNRELWGEEWIVGNDYELGDESSNSIILPQTNPHEPHNSANNVFRAGQGSANNGFGPIP